MFEGLTRRDVVIAAIIVMAVVALTVEGTYFGLHRYVLDNPAAPQTKLDALKPNLRAN
jgi:hypothetical protein